MPVEVPRGLPFAVDTWTPASSLKRHRFLTHAHRDHLAGITSTTSAPASIYASRLTILITLRIFPQLDPAAFVELEVGAPPLRIPDPDGDFTVTAFDANHCPGAVMFLFEGAFGTVLHTGDCRLTPDCLDALPLQRRIDCIFLDCTFARCPLPFPTKEDSIRQVIDCIWRHPNAPVVYLVCDMLGQEDVLIEVSRAFGSKIHVDRDKSPECHHRLSHIAPEILTDAAAASRFHLMAFSQLSERATEVLALARARQQPEPLIIRPSSQWYAHYEAPEEALHGRPMLTEPMRDEFGVWHVCLSMHSSREELEQALEILQPRWFVSTTPPCNALDLSYFKKHCSVSRLGTDDPLWKLLGMADIMSTVTGAPQSSSVTVEAIDNTEIAAVTCSAEEFRSDEGSSQVEAAAEPTLQGCEIRAEPPVTLFGGARFGVLQNELQLWKDEYQLVSAEAPTNAETEGMEDSAAQDSSPDKSVKVIDLTEAATAHQQSSATGTDMLIQHGKSVGKIDASNLAKDENLLVQVSSSTQSEFFKDDKLVEVTKGSEEAETEARQHDSTVCSNLQTICRTKVVEVSAVQISTADNNEETVKDDISPLETDKKFGQDSERASDTTSVIGTSRGLNANLRRLYRSMNVSVPRPLPSLVELMGASKRPRVSQTVQL